MRVLVLFVVCIVTGCVQQRVGNGDDTTLVESNSSKMKMRVKNVLTVETTNAGPVAFFSVTTTRMPPRKRFILQRGDYFDPESAFYHAISDDSGRLWVVEDERIALHKAIVPMMNLLPGEPSSLWLVSYDRKIQLRTTFVAYPLEAIASDGAEVVVTRVQRNGFLVRCEGNYFDKNEQLMLVLSSKNKKVEQEIVCQDGRFSTHLQPPDTKSFGELLTLDIVRKNGETLNLSYPWGRASYDKECLMASVEKMQRNDREQIDDAIEVYYWPYSDKAKSLV